MKQINTNLIENELWDEDSLLFNNIDGKYVSENERAFFETIREKMLTELAPCKELLISETKNPDRVYLLRDQYDEFIIGQGLKDNKKPEIHTMNLAAALNTNMKESGFLTENITLWEWLRKVDYNGVMFDHNYTYM